MAAITVLVKTMDESRYEVVVPSDSAVSELKSAIVEKTGVPTDRQRLIFRGRTLGNDETLSSCSIAEGSTVHLVARCVCVCVRS